MAEGNSVLEREVLVRRFKNIVSLSDTFSDPSVSAVANVERLPDEGSVSQELPLLAVKESSDLSLLKYGG